MLDISKAEHDPKNTHEWRQYERFSLPFRRCASDLERDNRNFQLAVYGLRRILSDPLDNVPNELLLLGVQVSGGLYFDSQVVAYTSTAVVRDLFAESGEDFPLLSGQHLVNLWTTLEVLVPEIAAVWLREFPQYRSPLARSFEAKSNSLTPEQTVSQLIRHHRPKPLHLQYDYVLTDAGLVNFDPKPDFSWISTLKAIRNLIVHMDCRVDLRFKSAVPTCNQDVGERLCITRTLADGYRNAISTYLEYVLNRARLSVPADNHYILTGQRAP